MLSADKVSLQELLRVAQELIDVAARELKSVLSMSLSTMPFWKTPGACFVWKLLRQGFPNQRKSIEDVRLQDGYAVAVQRCELLTSEHFAVEMLARRVDAGWLSEMGLPWRLDSGSRPRGTSGLPSNGKFFTGICNLGNSCWLNATLQCFRFCEPLRRDLVDGAIEKGPLGRLVRSTLR